MDREKFDRRVAVMGRLSERNKWSVPVTAILDHLLAQRLDLGLTDRQRCQLECRRLYHKTRFGSV